MRPEKQISRPRKCGVIFRFSIFVFLFSFFTACGYHVAGRGSALPAEWKTLAVPALENKTTRYRIEQRLTEALVRELLARTKYRIVADESSADAVLRGEVDRVESNAVLFDAATGRATAMVVTVQLKVRLIDRASGKVHYQNENFVFREQYEVSTDVNSFFEEQQPALDRLARDFAARLVSALLENF
ncbi:MAG TPA: LptE family protein [Candidatus Acidoferrales bacterium]|nr:LptE family protein [Candidatus Acidoferrales bacterium]